MPVLNLCLLLGCVFDGALEGQRAGAERFEVASVKRADLSNGANAAGISGKIIGGPGSVDPGQVTGTRITLSTLIRAAYDVLPDQLSGPGWMQTERYDIVAKVPPGPSKDVLKAMLRNLLAERFRLVIHRESKEFEGYALTIAGGGAKLKATAYPNAEPARPGMGNSVDAEGYPVIPGGKSGATGAPKDGTMCWTYQAVTLAALITNLQSELGSMSTLSTWSPGRVVDETGLAGKYDFRICYASSGQIGGALLPDSAAGPPVQDTAGEAASPGAGPSIFAAVEKQLGLKLSKRQVKAEVLVVDHAEQTPVEN